MRLLYAHSIALACALTFSSQARADDVTFTGFAHGAETVDFSLFAPNANASGSVYAGGFATVLNGGSSFVSYCVDLYQHISFGTLYPEYTAPGTTHVFANDRAYADLGRLYAEAGTIDTSIREAAFQIAVWEIAYETTAGPYDLNAGAARFSGGSAGSSGALVLASTWLAGAGAGAFERGTYVGRARRDGRIRTQRAAHDEGMTQQLACQLPCQNPPTQYPSSAGCLQGSC